MAWDSSVQAVELVASEAAVVPQKLLEDRRKM